MLKKLLPQHWTNLKPPESINVYPKGVDSGNCYGSLHDHDHSANSFMLNKQFICFCKGREKY